MSHVKSAWEYRMQLERQYYRNQFKRVSGSLRQQPLDAKQSFFGLHNARTADVTYSVIAYVIGASHVTGGKDASTSFVRTGVVTSEIRQFEAGFDVSQPSTPTNENAAFYLR